ncbi:MAG: sigma-54-dependent Fis family transcriptional regulator [Planctomycetes bacterium]|nr:sigma-54-dependent Fis family transcriptional regulator [Planctomycetota bacterium]
MSQKILVVDDEPVTCQLLDRVFAREGYSVSSAGSAAEAIGKGKATFFEVVITDLRLPESDGFEVLRGFREASPETQVILVTGYGSVEVAVRAVKEGAFDFISKPFKVEEIKLSVRRACEQRRLLRENRQLKEEMLEKYGMSSLVGRSKPMTEVYKTIAKVLDTRSTVLIQGESGTGKELVARAIHFNSHREGKPFLAINCASLPESLLESELFGHRRGAFTGAHYDKRGLFEEASGGTLLLDEIADTTPGLQAKLLRVLEEQKVRRIGENESIPVDVRIIAATNKDMTAAVQDGRFREDLYYRLNVITLHLCPLRERLEDLPLLVDHYLKKYNRDYGKQVAGMTPEAMERLWSYAWPGNVRELVHTIERAMALNTKNLISLDDLPTQIRQAPAETLLSLEEMERNHILRVLHACQGNRQKASDILAIDRKTLYRKALRYGLKMEGP